MNRTALKDLIDLVRWKGRQLILASTLFFLLGATSVITFYRNVEPTVLIIAFIAGTFLAALSIPFVYLLVPPFLDTGNR